MMSQSGMTGQAPSSSVSQDSSSTPSLSDEEFQEILTRNKSVSSSAISRAVQDASQGGLPFLALVLSAWNYVEQSGSQN